MKKEIIVFVVLCLFFVCFVSGQASYYDDYSDVLLVCNNESSVSMEICDYFQEKRISKGFNVSRRVNLTDVSISETIDDAEYIKIRDQINSTLQAVGVNEINYIVTTKGVPLRTSNRAVDSKLVLAFGSVENRFFHDIFSYEKYGYYLVTRLTGITVDDAKRLIDNSDNANLTGDILLNRYSSTYSSDWGTTEAHNILDGLGISNTLDNSIFVRNRWNLSGYWSWGSNAGCGINCKDSSNWNLSFVPGAIGETAVSTSARTFSRGWEGSGQSLIGDLISMNITGVKGYVYEPYIYAIATPDILFGRYASGYNLADSFYMASAYDGNWMDVIVGDPKAAVLISSTAPAIFLNNLIDGERINKSTLINFSIASSDFFDIDSVWYSTNGANCTLSSPYNIDTSSWVDGDYNLSVYSNDTNGNTGINSYSFVVGSTSGVTPEYSNFDGNTTDFKTESNRSNVSGAILEIVNAGKIVFLEDGLNFSGSDINKNVVLGHNSVMINSTALSDLNVSANVSLYNSPSSSYSRTDYLTILRDGVACNSTTSPACHNFTALNAETVIFNVSSWSEYSLGYSDSIAITTCSELQAIKDNLNESYILLNDIDCSETRVWNWNESYGSYMGFESLGNLTVPFRSFLNGNKYKISGLYINRSFEDNVGLVGVIDMGNITDLQLEDVSIVGKNNVGGFFGIYLPMYYEFEFVYVLNVSSSGNVSGNDYIGGIGGRFCNDSGAGMGSARVFSSFSVCDVSGNDYIGGLFGLTRTVADLVSLHFEDLYVSGNVSGNNYVGGIIGKHDGDCMWTGASAYFFYVSGNVSGNNYVGGLAGYLDGCSQGGMNPQNCFSTMNVSGNSNYSKLVGCYQRHSYWGQYWAYNQESPNWAYNLWYDNCSVYKWDRSACNAAEGCSWDTSEWCCSGDFVVFQHQNDSSDTIKENNSYFYNVSNSPISAWDFDSVWDDELDGVDYPVF